MAINLDFQAGGMQQFAKTDPGMAGVGYRRVGQAVNQAAKQAGDVVATVMNERDMRDAVLTIEESETAQAKALDANPYILADQLPEELIVGDRVEKDAGGNEIPRKFQRHEVEPQLRRYNSLKNLEAGASKIRNKRIRNEFVTKQKVAIEDNYQKNLTLAAQEAVEHNRAETATMVAELNRQGRFGMSDEVIQNSTVFSDEEKSAKIHQNKVGREYYTANNFLVKPDLTATDMRKMDDIIQAYGKEDYSGPLSQDERIELSNKLQRKMRASTAKKATSATLAQRRREIALQEQINTEEGAITEGLLAREAEQGNITGGMYTSLSKNLLASYEKKAEEAKTMANVTAQLATGHKVFRTPENTRAVNNIYETQVSDYVKTVGPTNVDPQQVNDIGLAVTRSSGILPNAVESQFIAANDGDPNQLIAAGNLYNRYQDTVPAAMDDIGGNTQSLSIVAAHMRNGVTPDKAVEAAMRIRDLTPEGREVHKDLWRQWTQAQTGKTSPLEATLQEKMDNDPNWDIPWRMGSIEPDNTATAYYESMVKAHFDVTGDMAVSATWAMDEFNRMFAPSNINNLDDNKLWGGKDSFQAFSPPLPTDETALNMIRNDVERQNKDIMTEGATLELRSDAWTMDNSAPGAPQYKVFIYQDDGTVDVGVYIVDEARIEKTAQISAAETRVENLGKRIKNQRELIQKSPAGRTARAHENLAELQRDRDYWNAQLKEIRGDE